MRVEVGGEPVRARARARARARRPPAGRPRRQAAGRLGRRAAAALAVLTVATLAATVAFAGSPDRIASGVRVAGVDVGGLTVAEAESFLSARAARYASVPVVFTAGNRRWSLRPGELDVRVDWRRAAREAHAAGDGAWLVRGLKRLRLAALGAEVEPAAHVDPAALLVHVERMARAVDARPRDAAIALRGLRPVVTPSRPGRELDAEAVERTIVAALARFERRPVPLPVLREEPSVATDALVPVARDVRTALASPVGFTYNGTHWRIRPPELAPFLVLPADGRRRLRIGGAAADAYFARLARAVDRKPKDADFAIDPGWRVRVVPGVNGRRLDVAATAKALLAAAVSPYEREAELVVRTVEPKLTTRKARSLGITRVLSSYSTPYSGSADRIRNLQLAVSLLDGTLVAPGATFSFNRAVGPRTEARGFRPAPVIVGGDYQDGIGGGVSQVATTVFNAAWEAGLRISSRTAHALYISRYPLGRDATVSYPDIDLTFVNDTRGWLFVRARAEATGITVSLLGAPTGRRVESETGALRETAPPAVKRIPDPALYEGERVVVDDGEPARAVTLTRTVYARDTVLHAETWTTTYRSQPKVVRVGTRTRPAEPQSPAPPPPKPAPERKEKEKKKAPTPPADGKSATMPAATAP